MRKGITLFCATLAALGLSVPAQAQRYVASLLDLDEARQTCFAATEQSEVDRLVIATSGWRPMKLVDDITGEQSLSDAIYYHPGSRALIVAVPDKSTCTARALVASMTEFETYAEQFSEMNPERTESGGYLFCSSGRATLLRLTSTPNGPVILATYKTKPETHTCPS
ncbi:MAG: hypothetical protein AAGB18_09285 [Pseudomonadota bacterium]